MERDQPQIGIVESQTAADGSLTWLETSKIPLHDAEGNLLGILGIYRDITDTKNSEQALQQSHSRLEQSKGELEAIVQMRTRQLEHMATHDGLTDLVNREAFVECLTSELERTTNHSALLFVDVDRFKVVNDTLGHAAGDKLLIEVANVLRNSVRPNDVVSRFGGDEFTVLLRNLRNTEEVVAVAHRIQSAFREIAFESSQLTVSASIGIALFASGDYTDTSDLIRDADIALYVAKQNGKAQHCFFDNDMLMNVRRRTEIEQQLRTGLSRKQFTLAYHPILRTSDQELVAFEALARWRHPTDGLLSPATFLDIAEETGLIREMGDLLLNEACQQLWAWRQQHPGMQNVKLNFNLSASQVTDESCDVLEQIVRANGLEPSDVQIEITETLLLNGDACLETLSAIRSQGFRLVLDDFGTGYSSLSYLHRFPISVLKIDRSFVSSMETSKSQEIIRSIVGLAHLLDLQVVAEGVVTPTQVDRLKEMGCDFLQGFLFSKPMLAENADEYIKLRNAEETAS